MTAKHLRYSNEAREALHRGVDSVANAVSVTLGPRGRNVVIDKRFGAPLIINDGVTIARDLDFKDPFENMGAQLLKEIAVKTNDIAGDGTTTATVLGRALINEGLRNLAAGASPTELRRGMLAAAEAVAAAVRSQSHPVAGNEDLERVATISSGDEVIGTMVALGQWDEFRLHVRAALTGGGFSQDDIEEVILQQAIYCGVPAANHAFKEAAEVMAELAKAK